MMRVTSLSSRHPLGVTSLSSRHPLGVGQLLRVGGEESRMRASKRYFETQSQENLLTFYRAKGLN